VKVTQERRIKVEIPADVISQRLGAWATKHGFVCTKASPGCWEFTRGTHLQAAFTFDVRKIPTTVNVKAPSDESGDLVCSFVVGSLLSLQTAGDQKRISEQFDILEAHLKGAL